MLVGWLIERVDRFLHRKIIRVWWVVEFVENINGDIHPQKMYFTTNDRADNFVTYLNAQFSGIVSQIKVYKENEYVDSRTLAPRRR